MPGIVYARGDDWCGLYIGGTLRTEGHSIEISDFVETVIENDGDLSTFEARFVNADWLYDEGSLPHFISAVIWEGEHYEKPPYDEETDSDLDFMSDDIEF